MCPQSGSSLWDALLTHSPLQFEIPQFTLYLAKAHENVSVATFISIVERLLSSGPETDTGMQKEGNRRSYYVCNLTNLICKKLEVDAR